MPLAKALGVTTDYLLGITQGQEQEQTQTADTSAGRGSQETAQASGPRCYTGQTDAKPRKHADRPAERFSFHPTQLLRCYRSLTIFNKIGAWTAVLTLLVPLFGLALLPHASLLMQLYPLVVMGLPQVGLLSLILGFILGLVDLYDKQVKAGHPRGRQSCRRRRAADRPSADLESVVCQFFLENLRIERYQKPRQRSFFSLTSCRCFLYNRLVDASRAL